jgi:hypothetical protein
MGRDRVAQRLKPLDKVALNRLARGYTGQRTDAATGLDYHDV